MNRRHASSVWAIVKVCKAKIKLKISMAYRHYKRFLSRNLMVPAGTSLVANSNCVWTALATIRHPC